LIINSRRVGRVVFDRGYTELARESSGLPSGAAILGDAGITVEHWQA